MSGGFEAGQRFGDFELLEIAGRGGMGIVYRARQITLERIVALKVISPAVADAPDFTTRFRRESRLAASIEHPHVVSIYSAGEIEGRAFIAMQWIDGVSLDALLADRVPLPEERTRILISQVASALDIAHSAGLIHRDVKPPNVLVRTIAGSDHSYLTDFGIARKVDVGATGLTKTGQTVGTVGYMAPEQIRGEAIDGRSDIYSLGCVLYQCLTGRKPFEHETEVAIMFAHVSEDRPRPSALRPELAAYDDLIARSLALDPADRFQTGAELRAALAAAASGTPAPVVPATAPSAAPAETSTGATARLPQPPPPPVAPPPARPVERKPSRGKRIAIALGVVALIAGVAFGAFAATGGLDAPDSTTVISGQEGTEGENGSGGGGGGSGGTEVDEGADREAIGSTLTAYETAYTNQDTDALDSLFTGDVFRRGIGQGGACTETTGKDEVLGTYSAQFETGTGAYSLTDTSEDVIELDGDLAKVSTGYEISSGASGSITFELSRSGSEWLISRVEASC